MKTVIYKVLGSYKATNEANYNARIQDARKVMDCSEFESPEEIKEYYIKYFGAKEDEFIVID